MLRASLRSSRAIGHTSSVSNVARQWQGIQAGRVASGALRGYADKSSIRDSRPIVLPGSRSSATSEPAPPGPVATTINASNVREAGLTGTPAASATSAIPQIPLTPPEPSPVVASSSPSPPPPPPTPTLAQAPKPRRFFRKFFLTLFFLSALGYGGGLYYCTLNDNFHDFFTEYVPFGEEALLYFEEREFRKRYPKKGGLPRDTGALTKIPSQSGVSWRVSDDRRANAESPKPKEALNEPGIARSVEKVEAVKAVKKDEPKPAPVPIVKEALPPASVPVVQAPAETAAPQKVKAPATKKNGVSFVEPEVDQPSKFPPEITRIDPINIKDASEPLVQDLVKIINDLIAVVNQDNANSRFSSTFEKAKREISKFGGKIQGLKAAAEKEADAKVTSEKSDFDRAAKELIRRLEAEMAQQQTQWQEEYQTERQRIQQTYEQKLKAEVEKAHQVNEQKLQNSLLEQAVELKRKFIADVQSRVEEERDGRLGKLTDLSKTVNELEKLTTDWTSIVDANLKTQHLHVAVEAVRSNLEKSQVPRPFTKELAALKEIASDDPVVNAAIASINPVAYQRGVPSSAQLIDRFRRVATEVRKASLLPEEAGVASHASSYVLSKLLFKKKGLATGNDVESVLTRTETFLEEGDLDGAAREMNGLQGWAKTLSRDWLGEVRRVLEVQQALDVIATEARLQSLRVE